MEPIRLTSSKAGNCFQELKPGDSKVPDSDDRESSKWCIFSKYCDKDFNFLSCQEFLGAGQLCRTASRNPTEIKLQS